MSGRIFAPREYIEHQLNMTPEEKEHRQVFFAELFAKHNTEREHEHV